MQQITGDVLKYATTLLEATRAHVAMATNWTLQIGILVLVSKQVKTETRILSLFSATWNYVNFIFPQCHRTVVTHFSLKYEIYLALLIREYIKKSNYDNDNINL